MLRKFMQIGSWDEVGSRPFIAVRRLCTLWQNPFFVIKKIRGKILFHWLLNFAPKIDLNKILITKKCILSQCAVAALKFDDEIILTTLLVPNSTEFTSSSWRRNRITFFYLQDRRKKKITKRKTVSDDGQFWHCFSICIFFFRTETFRQTSRGGRTGSAVAIAGQEKRPFFKGQGQFPIW